MRFDRVLFGRQQSRLDPKDPLQNACEIAVQIKDEVSLTQLNGGSGSGTTDNVCLRHLSAKQEREWRTPSIL